MNLLAVYWPLYKHQRVLESNVEKFNTMQHGPSANTTPNLELTNVAW